ncbi:MAG TPA: P-loop ATPase [Candidatus Parcubacteria bacterium]|nr:P-loop ATPase [Candidatus Parcubacteria bacterium]
MSGWLYLLVSLFFVEKLLNSMFKIAIASGKGGVGKSMISSSLLILFSKDKKKVIGVDCDVDAPNLAVWLGEPEKWEKIEKISVSEKPAINNKNLTKEQAEECAKKCRFRALELKGEKLVLNRFLCEGCGACEVFCPDGVIKMRTVESGEIKTKITDYGFPIVSGQLYPGESGSGKVVAEVKKRAENLDGEIMVIDSAPGTSCPVTASFQGVDFVLLVTEPTLSGFSDFERVLEIVDYFKISWGLVINKYEINQDLAKEIRRKSGKRFFGKVSYDKNIFTSVSNLRPIVKTNLKAKKEIEIIYKKLVKKIYYGQANKKKKGFF